jgi:hypothetical protein
MIGRCGVKVDCPAACWTFAAGFNGYFGDSEGCAQHTVALSGFGLVDHSKPSREEVK